MAADSTMLRMVNLLMALSLGVHREQLEHRIGLTWPRPFLLRPLFNSESDCQPIYARTISNFYSAISSIFLYSKNSFPIPIYCPASKGGGLRAP